MTDTAFSLARTARTLALGLLLSALALPAPAAERDPAEILALQIDMAGRQRMLSQRLVASACFLSLGIQHDTQALALTEVSEIYEATLDRLEKGNTLLGLPAVTDPQALWALRDARAAACRPSGRGCAVGGYQPPDPSHAGATRTGGA